MNNNSLVFCIGSAIIVVSFVMVLTKVTVDMTPYKIIGAALMLGGMVNAILGEIKC